MNKDYLDKLCPYCKTKFNEEDEIVICSNCEMPHHKECWVENKACTTFGCSGAISNLQNKPNEKTLDYTDDIEILDEKKVSFANEINPAVRYCSNCGTKVYVNQMFCSSCGTKIGEIRESKQTFRQAETRSKPENKRATPNGNYEYNQPVNDMARDLPQFIDTNWNYYIERFNNMDMNRTKVNWNWASAFFTVYWFAYRKMYKYAGGILAAYFIFLLTPLSGFVGLGLFVVCGLYGTSFYQQYVSDEIKIANTMNPQAKIEYLGKKGGTSASSVWVFIGIQIVLIIILSIITTM